MGQEIIQNKQAHIDKNNLNSYNEFKEYKGKKYTGMKVGRSHKWYYEKGVWKEKKIMPDKWDFTYDVKKRRAGNAPDGSGVPVGTEYHWYILADQNVKKLDANNYTTSMIGVKYKLAHKRSTSEKWSATDYARKTRLIQVLEETIGQLKKELSKTASNLNK
jgi:hypothetical protein